MKKQRKASPKKGKSKITVSKKSLAKEHKHLVKVLKSGSKKSRSKEASKQKKELMEYTA